VRRFTLALGALTLITCAQTVSAQRRLTGIVTESGTGQPVDAASITVPGTTIGTHTGDDGRFALTIPSGPQTVRVRRIGYRLQDIAVTADQGDIRVAMVRDVLQLEAQIITGAVTSVARANAANDVAQVTGTDLNRAPTPTLENALQAKIAGATVTTNSGAPGGGAQFRIRGASSILGNSDPLIVVDGVIVSNQVIEPGTNSVLQAIRNTSEASDQDNGTNRLADLNENEIESVQVLKSAAASAIYGSMATNGVVLITTKRGHQGATQFNITQRVGTNQVMRLLGSRHFTNATLKDVVGATQANKYCPTDPCPYYDYQKELYGQTGLAYETSLSLTGGTDVTKYFVSANDKGDPGTMINTNARRQDMRLNIDQAFGTKWTANASASIFRSQTARGISNNDNTFTSPLYAFGYTPAVVDLRQTQNGHPIDNLLLASLFGTGSNPFQTISAVKNNEDVWRQLGSAQIRYSAFTSQSQSLAFSAIGGFDRFDSDGETYSPNYLQFEPDDGFPGTAVQAEALSRQYNGQVNAVHTYTPNDVRFIGWLTTLTSAAGLQYEDRALNQYERACNR